MTQKTETPVQTKSGNDKFTVFTLRAGVSQAKPALDQDASDALSSPLRREQIRNHDHNSISEAGYKNKMALSSSQVCTC